MTVQYHDVTFRRFILTGLGLMLTLGLTQSIPAEDKVRLAELKAEEVRQLRESGDIMPLENLLQDIRAEHPGRVIEIELDEEDNRHVYEIEMVSDDGSVWELHFDARTGELLERERED